MQHSRRHQPHCSAATPIGSTLATTPVSLFNSDQKRGKKRGGYNCGRCGQPKKGHSCHVSPSETTHIDSSDDISAPSLSATRPSPPPRPYSHLRRALSFDEDFDSPVPNGGFCEEDEHEDSVMDLDSDPGSSGLPSVALWEVLRRLPPVGLLSAAKVCKGWRETARRLWKAAEVLRIRVPVGAQVGFVGSVLQKCPGLVSLTLRMERYWGFKMRLSRI